MTRAKHGNREKAPALLAVRMVPIEDVIPYARNPRRNEGAVAKVAASIREFGWRQPIVVDEAMTVIAGHTRLLAARQLGQAEVAVHIAAGLTPAQVKAYRLADNRVGEGVEWDAELLALEFGDLAEADFDLTLTGFEPEEITAALPREFEPGTLNEQGQLDSKSPVTCPNCGAEFHP
jgi:ParB-like chromosome segregation protein Spo0J